MGTRLDAGTTPVVSLHCRGGKIGVDVFILISGYFLSRGNRSISTNARKLLMLWGQLFFYAVLVNTGLVFVREGEINLRHSLVSAASTITFSGWWFARTYAVMFLFHPFFNKLIAALNRRTHQYLIVLLVAYFYVYPSFSRTASDGNPLLRFTTLYFIAAYVRIYGFNPRFTCRRYFRFFALFTALAYLLTVGLTLLGTRYAALAYVASHLWLPQYLHILLISLTLFLAFSKIKIRHNKCLNLLASTMFGVYLLHDNGYVASFLWTEIFKVNHFQSSPLFVPYTFLVVFIVFAVCVPIDLLRQRSFERLLTMGVNRYLERVLQVVGRLYRRLMPAVFGR